MTVVLITCSYRGQEFVRVGYYVNNEYEEEQLKVEPPPQPIIEKLVRNILADKPRVTRFPIKWDAVDELVVPHEVAMQVDPLIDEDDNFDEDHELEEDTAEDVSQAFDAIVEGSPEHQSISLNGNQSKPSPSVSPLLPNSPLSFSTRL